MEVFCLRVAYREAGRTFPFDRVYLVNYDNRDVIERMFRYALVLPVEGELRTMLEAVSLDQYVNRTFHRDDAENASTKLPAGAWVDMIKSGEWILVVPLLPKWMHKNMPRYLTAENWYAATKAKGQRYKRVQRTSPFTNRSYLQTPHKKIRPICVVCPRMVLHQNGECQIGEAICFESLPLGMVNHFEEAAALPEPMPNVLEQEEYALIEGSDLPWNPPATTKTRTLLKVIHE
jgi:hypothetical protein